MRLKALLAAMLLSISPAAGQPQGAPLPAGPLKFAGFSARFGTDGSFALEGPGWPPFKGTWKRQGSEIELLTGGDAAGGCDKAGRYRATVDTGKGHVTFDLVDDACTPRRMILDRCSWRPSDEVVPIPVRHIVLTAASPRVTIPAAAPADG